MVQAALVESVTEASLATQEPKVTVVSVEAVASQASSLVLPVSQESLLALVAQALAH